jgi:hypothetical protein
MARPAGRVSFRQPCPGRKADRMRSVATAWARLSRVQRTVVAAVVGVAAILGGVKATTWAENSLGRPRYEVVWETELPEADRAYATVTSDGQYVVVLHRDWIKRAYKLSPDGRIAWGLEFAPKSSLWQVEIGSRRGEQSETIYNENLGIWGVIPTADGGAMAYGGINRVFNRSTVPNSESTGYVASIGSDGKLRWQGEIRPSSGWRTGTSFGLSPAVPYAAGGLFFSQARRARESSAAGVDDKPNFTIAWWLQLDPDGKVVGEHFDLNAEQAGYETSLRAPVWVEGRLYLLRGSRQVVDLATRRKLPFGESNETIVELNPASGAIEVRAELPYTCTRLVPIPNGSVLSCYDRKFDLAVATDSPCGSTLASRLVRAWWCGNELIQGEGLAETSSCRRQLRRFIPRAHRVRQSAVVKCASVCLTNRVRLSLNDGFTGCSGTPRPGVLFAPWTRTRCSSCEPNTRATTCRLTVARS